jgi:glycine cleavage system transcriptional repressor
MQKTEPQKAGVSKSCSLGKQSLLVISAIAPNRPGIANDISVLIADSGCNIKESKMKMMGGTFSLVLMASGSWNAIAKLEHILPKKACALGMTTMLRRTDDISPRPDRLPYQVSIVALDSLGITREITAFFAQQDINIREMSCDTYIAPHSSAPIAEIKLTVGVSTDLSIANIREEFGTFCRKLNLDATIEPITR